MLKKISTLLAALAVGVVMCAGSAAAQTATSPTQPATAQPVGPATNDPGHPRVNQVDNRLEHQQDRIQQGIKSGTLTKQQARQLYGNDLKVARQERKDMGAQGGHLTKSEQRQFNKALNQNSKQIYKEKHQ